jgi:hypothetical protein
MRTEFGYLRTSCDCQVCQNNCRIMPGFLIPTDLGRLLPPSTDPFAWADENLLASPGALILRAGKLDRIRTLVPATKADGSCIHLTGCGRCAIHPVAPFGCAFFDCGPERGQLSQHGLYEVLDAWQRRPTLYAALWDHLWANGRQQYPPEELRARMSHAQL